jgi:hypothetical protein
LQLDGHSVFNRKHSCDGILVPVSHNQQEKIVQVSDLVPESGLRFACTVGETESRAHCRLGWAIRYADIMFENAALISFRSPMFRRLVTDR